MLFYSVGTPLYSIPISLSLFPFSILHLALGVFVFVLRFILKREHLMDLTIALPWYAQINLIKSIAFHFHSTFPVEPLHACAFAYVCVPRRTFCLRSFRIFVD